VVKGHQFRTKGGLLVYDDPWPANGSTLRVCAAGHGPGFDALPIAIAPAGTLLRPVQAVGEFCEMGSVTTYGIIDSGPFAGRKAVLDDVLIKPLSDVSGIRDTKHWEANPQYIEEVR
jgi:hypothetical protein